MHFSNNIPPKIYTLSATIVGFILLDDTNAAEQNALGNWLMLVAQVLCTNAYFKQLHTSQETNNPPSNEETFEMLQKMVNALTKEIEEIKKSI